MRPRIAIGCVVVAMSAAVPLRAAAQPPGGIDRVLNPGQPLRVALDDRTIVNRVGQPVTGTLVDALYAYDRVVVPAGTTVLGHIARLEDPPRISRVRAVIGGDLSPTHIVTLQFDAFLLSDGRQLSFGTVVNGSTSRVALKMAEGADTEEKNATKGDEPSGAIARTKDEAKARLSEEVNRAKDEARQARDRVMNARQEASQKARDALAAIKSPGKMARLRDAAVSRLPYHPQFLSKGTVFDAELTTALDFGVAPAAEAAPAGAAPAPASL
ncbi:MAG TPA: hypothetical protein VGY57_06150, partial [Vicinamibacterales bacterium]|nr:hypothetical protein [Vicinamibacterales bacterium]